MELIIVVSIIGMLAAIAIPNYLRYQLRTRATASMTHLSAIATVQSAYYSEHGTYVSVSTPVPATLPGTARVAWPAGSAFDLLGFAPEGSVRFQYAVGADDAGTGSGTLQRFTAEAAAEARAARWGRRQVPPRRSPRRRPCDPASGRSRF